MTKLPAAIVVDPCPTCGGPMEFDETYGVFWCETCGDETYGEEDWDEDWEDSDASDC